MAHRQSLKWPHRFIDTEEALKTCAKVLKGSASAGQNVAVDVEAFCVEKNSRHLGQVSLLQLCGPADPNVYIIDVLTLGAERVAHYIKRVLCHPEIRKVMFDCRKDVEALSTQMGLTCVNVLDLQLFHTASLWTTRGTNRRSNMDWVLRNLTGVASSEELKAVEAAFEYGNRNVWDERPLPEHLVAYAANDVRHMLVLAEHLKNANSEIEDKVVELSQKYIDYYATGTLAEKDVDPKANEVSKKWLEEVFGQGGGCAYCGGKGHDDTNCFKKEKEKMKCQNCGDIGHLTNKCFKIHPEKNKCSHCGQSGHQSGKCFLLHPCTKCGGKHPTEKCQGLPAVAKEAVNVKSATKVERLLRRPKAPKSAAEVLAESESTLRRPTTGGKSFAAIADEGDDDFPAPGTKKAVSAFDDDDGEVAPAKKVAFRK